MVEQGADGGGLSQFAPAAAAAAASCNSGKNICRPWRARWLLACTLHRNPGIVADRSLVGLAQKNGGRAPRADEEGRAGQGAARQEDMWSRFEGWLPGLPGGLVGDGWRARGRVGATPALAADGPTEVDSAAPCDDYRDHHNGAGEKAALMAGVPAVGALDDGLALPGLTSAAGLFQIGSPSPSTSPSLRQPMGHHEAGCTTDVGIGGSGEGMEWCSVGGRLPVEACGGRGCGCSDVDDGGRSNGGDGLGEVRRGEIRPYAFSTIERFDETGSW
jgi:hypothetical protein